MLRCLVSRTLRQAMVSLMIEARHELPAAYSCGLFIGLRGVATAACALSKGFWGASREARARGVNVYADMVAAC